MRVLLVNTPVEYPVPDIWRTESLGLGYIASVLRREGHEVEIFDAHCQFLNVGQTIEGILARDWDCVGFTTSQAHRQILAKLLPPIKKQRPGAPIVLGGYLPTLTAGYLLEERPEIDMIVRGEGEQVAADLIGRLARGEEWRDTPGVGYLADGKLVLNPPPPVIHDLDSLPFPARDAFAQSKIPVSAGIATSRGCYHHCSFCCVQSFYELSGGRGQRMRSPENVVAEIEEVVETTGVRTFRFLDDDFLGPGRKTQERACRIAELIRERKLGITFSTEFRADEVEEETVLLLKEAGLTDVFLGIESGVQRQLDTYNKGTTVEQNRRAIEIVRKAGVNLRCGYIMFDPYVTASELADSFQFCSELGIIKEASKTPVQFISKMVLHRGVPMEDKLREDGLLREDGASVDWKFKHLSAAAVWATLSALGKCSDALRRLKRRKR